MLNPRLLVLLYALFVLTPVSWADDNTVNFIPPTIFQCSLPFQEPYNANINVTNSILIHLESAGKPFFTASGEAISLDDRGPYASGGFHLNLLATTVDVAIWPRSHGPPSGEKKRVFSCRLQYTTTKSDNICSTESATLSNCMEKGGSSARPEAPAEQVPPAVSGSTD